MVPDIALGTARGSKPSLLLTRAYATVYLVLLLLGRHLFPSVPPLLLEMGHLRLVSLRQQARVRLTLCLLVYALGPTRALSRV